MAKIPRGVWVLGFVSLFMDMSSEMIHALMPLYLVGTLGVSAAILGLIEGLAEATAQITKLFSGILSDRLQNRKNLSLLGYGLAAIVKPVFPLSETAVGIFSARMVDRIGKGIRGAPRDALVADITPLEMRGAAFGLRQSLDTVGAFLGPLIAVGLMIFYVDDIRSVLWFACVPAAMAVFILAVGISEPASATPTKKKPGLDWSTTKLLGRPFWLVCGISAVFMLARFSEAFLVLKAAEAGLAWRYVPLVLVVMSLLYALTAYPAGMISDRIGRKGLLIFSLVVLLGADLVLAFGTGLAAMFIGVALWGVHMGLSQSLLSTMVANTAPADLRATGFGVFSVVSGVTALAASVLAGVLWDSAGSSMTFIAGGGFAGFAILLLSLWRGEESGIAAKGNL